MQQPVSVARRRQWALAPLVLLVLLAAAWSGVWFYAAHRVESTIAAWIERETKEGRVYACGSRTVGGYPFRIEMRCEEPHVELRGNGERLMLQGRALVAVAGVFQSDLITAQITGPLTIASGVGVPDYTAEWTLFQVSLHGLPWAFQGLSFVLDDPKLQRPGEAEPTLQAKRFAVDVRRHPGGDGSNLALDLAANAAAVVIAGVPQLAPRPIDAQAAAVLHGVNALSPKPLPERLRDWQAAGGKFDLTSARLAQGDAIAVATGSIRLTAQARLDGGLQMTLAGLDQIAPLILGPGGNQARVQGVVALLSMLGRAELEGKRAISVPLRFKDGAVFFGPLPLGQTAPLY